MSDGAVSEELVDQLDGAARVVDRRGDLAAVTHDARIGEQALHVTIVEAADHARVEAGERLTEVVALAQDGQPRQPGLEPLEAELLVEPVVVGDRPAPFGVVVRDVQRVVSAPPAPDDPVGTCAETGAHRPGW